MEDLEFNPFDEATRRNPFPLFARARRDHPVYPHSGFPIVSVFRHEDTMAILKDPATWSSRFPPPPSVDPTLLGDPSMLGQDPPEHDRLRGLVNQAFTPRIIRRLEPRMREIADGLLERALQAGEVDLVETLTHPLPVVIIAEIIGVPAEDREQFKVWSDAAVENFGSALFVPPAPEHLQKLHRLFTEMGDYFSRLGELRRRQPQEDLLSGLVQAELQGSKLTHVEMIRMLILLLVAGNETTTSLIGNSVLTLLDHPEELARLRQQPELMPSAIEEILRFSSPVQLDPRRATRAVTLRGHTMKKCSRTPIASTSRVTTTATLRSDSARTTASEQTWRVWRRVSHWTPFFSAPGRSRGSGMIPCPCTRASSSAA
jgi:cytochrome P450